MLLKIWVKALRIGYPSVRNFQALIIAVLWDIILSPILTIVARVFKIDSGLKFGHIYAGMVHASLIRTLVFLVDVGRAI